MELICERLIDTMKSNSSNIGNQVELPLKKGNKQKKAFVSSVYACVASERYIAQKIGNRIPEGPKSDKWEFFKFSFLIKKKTIQRRRKGECFNNLVRATLITISRAVICID